MLADMWRIDERRTPMASSSCRGPMPDSSSKWGEPTAPALKITSLRAQATLISPVASTILDARGPCLSGRALEQHARQPAPR